MALQRFKHQSELFERTKDLPFFAEFWEMRVGKNLPIIDTATYLFNQNKIDAVLIIAPSGVHINWARKVIPPERPSYDNIIEWSSGNANKVSFRRRLNECLADKGRLLWVCANIESVTTDAFKDFHADFVKLRNAMRVIDESDIIKSPSAKRTKLLIKWTPLFPYRRILTGTAAPESPFDLWSQLECLDSGILNNRYTPFKQRYGVFKRVRFGGPAFDQLVSYRDLDHLTKLIAPHVSRLTQADVYDNLPELIPETRTFIMTKEQQAAYESMRDDMMLQIKEGLVVTATIAITMMLRLQQISRGFVSQGETVHAIEGRNPAVEALLGALRQIDGKVIIWCNFTEDVNLILAAMAEAGLKAARYDGQVSKDQRYINLNSFLADKDVLYLVGTPATGGVGLDVSVAETTIFYSHSYKLRERLQAIARNQGPNQKASKLLLLSILGEGTGDARCIERLEQKRIMMKSLMGDKMEFEEPEEKETALEILKQFLEA